MVITSLSDVINLRRNAASLDVSPEFDTYSSVEVILAKEGNRNKVITVGDDRGRKMTIQMTQCADSDQAMVAASRILEQLRSRGFAYQPYEANDCLLDPSAEIGDAVTINGMYSGIYNREINCTPLLRTRLTAPQDEALDHEYAIKTSSNKVLTREMGQAYSQMSINAEAIRMEVRRASEAEGELFSAIEQTAEKITAKVDSRSDGSSFGWNLTADKWEVFDNKKTIFSVDKTGAFVHGKIEADEGAIGGFSIGSRSIYNNIDSMSSTLTSGVYVGTDGIKLGNRFEVNSSGSVTIKGTLTVGDSTITANTLRMGASSGNSYRLNTSKKDPDTGDIPKYFTATNLYCQNLDVNDSISADSLNVGDVEATSVYCSTFNDHRVSWKTVNIDGTTYHLLGY